MLSRVVRNSLLDVLLAIDRKSRVQTISTYPMDILNLRDSELHGTIVNICTVKYLCIKPLLILKVIVISVMLLTGVGFISNVNISFATINPSDTLEQLSDIQTPSETILESPETSTTQNVPQSQTDDPESRDCSDFEQQKKVPCPDGILQTQADDCLPAAPTTYTDPLPEECPEGTFGTQPNCEPIELTAELDPAAEQEIVELFAANDKTVYTPVDDTPEKTFCWLEDTGVMYKLHCFEYVPLPSDFCTLQPIEKEDPVLKICP
jgi:hypothetical protein